MARNVWMKHRKGVENRGEMKKAALFEGIKKDCMTMDSGII